MKKICLSIFAKADPSGLVIGDDQMLHISLVSTADIVGILLVETVDIEIILIQRTDIFGVFDDQQELGGSGLQGFCQPCLVVLIKGATFVIGKLGVIRRIQENEVTFIDANLIEELLKVQAAKLGSP